MGKSWFSLAQRVRDVNSGLGARWEPAADVEAALRLVRIFLAEALYSAGPDRHHGERAEGEDRRGDDELRPR